jgi:Ammonia permease
MLKKCILPLCLIFPTCAFADVVLEHADNADNGFMMICTALVLFMSIPGIALFYGGLLRSKNVLSMLSQVLVTFSLFLCYGSFMVTRLLLVREIGFLVISNICS